MFERTEQRQRKGKGKGKGKGKSWSEGSGYIRYVRWMDGLKKSTLFGKATSSWRVR